MRITIEIDQASAQNVSVVREPAVRDVAEGAATDGGASLAVDPFLEDIDVGTGDGFEHAQGNGEADSAGGPPPELLEALRD